jgi:hypothetical protein
MNRESIELKEKVKSVESSNTCPDYDDDCHDVKDPVSCWMGNECLDRAQGLCPLIHNSN